MKTEDRPVSIEDMAHEFGKELKPGNPKKAIGGSLPWMRKDGLVIQGENGFWSLTEKGRNFKPVEVSLERPAPAIRVMSPQVGVPQQLTAMQKSRSPFRVVILENVIDRADVQALYAMLEGGAFIELNPEDSLICLGPSEVSFSENQTVNYQVVSYGLLLADGQVIVTSVKEVGTPVTKAKLQEAWGWLINQKNNI